MDATIFFYESYDKRNEQPFQKDARLIWFHDNQWRRNNIDIKKQQRDRADEAWAKKEEPEERLTGAFTSGGNAGDTLTRY